MMKKDPRVVGKRAGEHSIRNREREVCIEKEEGTVPKAAKRSGGYDTEVPLNLAVEVGHDP